jgi:hypothetical protein
MAVKLKLSYDTADEIPEGYADLYTEADGKQKLTGIEGLKTQADIDRQLEGNRRERAAHKATKDLLKKIADTFDIDIDDTDAIDAKVAELSDKLARAAELEARGVGDGKLTDPEREELVALRKEVGPLKVAVTKLEREKKNLGDKVVTLETEKGQLTGTIRKGTIKEAVHAEATKQKALPEALKHLVRMGEDELEIDPETGAVTVKDTGVSVADWLGQKREDEPLFWPQSVGAGARGGDKGPMGPNPWSAAKWNKTEQSRIRKEKGDEVAARMAESAGSSLGATKPPVAAKAA